MSADNRYETFNDLFDDLFKKQRSLTSAEHTALQNRQRAFFEKAFAQDEPYLASFLSNKHLEAFGSLFRKLCDIIDISQNKLSDISKKGYGELVDKNILKASANIGSLSHDSISNAQLGSIRPTPQQVYFWIILLKQCFSELNLEILPEAEKAFYLLGTGGSPREIGDAVNFVKGIGPTQQWKIARIIETERNTDCNISCSNYNSDMKREDIVKVHTALAQFMKEQEPQH